MAFRFRKSVKLIPGVKLNFSKSGISTTVGRRGASVTIGKRGTYINTGIPGTGVSYRKRVGNSRSSEGSKKETSENSKPDYFIDSFKSISSGALKFAFLTFIFGLASFIIFSFINAELIILSVLAIFASLMGYLVFLSSVPGKAASFVRKARKKASEGKLDEALEALIEADKLHPTQGIKDDIARIAFSLQKPELVLKCLEQKELKTFEENFTLGMASKALGDFNQSIMYFEAILDEASKKGLEADKFYFHYGEALAKAKKEEKAITFLKKVSDYSSVQKVSSKYLSFDEDYSTQAAKVIGSCYYNMENYKEAENSLRFNLVSSNIDDIHQMEIAYLLGKSYMKLGDKRTANVYLNKVYTQNPKYQDVEQLLADLNNQLG